MNSAVAINARIFTSIISSFHFELIRNNSGLNPRELINLSPVNSIFNGMNYISTISNRSNIMNNNI